MTDSAAAAYIALGDSISIDDYSGGPGCGGASLLFRNRDDDYPQWRGRDLVSDEPDATFRLLATDGAKTRTLLDAQLRRLAALRVRPTLVTLTIGGNDVLSTYGDTAAARDTIGRVALAVSRALSDLRPLLAPAGRVVVGHGVRPERRYGRRQATRATAVAGRRTRHRGAQRGAATRCRSARRCGRGDR